MGRIQSSVGLITGVQIEDTVDQLMRLNGLPRDRLISRNTGLQQEQVALTEVTALVVGVQLTTDRLGQASLFSTTKVSSAKTDVLTARSTGAPKTGSYSFIPVRQAQSQQLTSSLFASSSQKLSAGEVVIHTGGFLDSSVNLDALNNGAGVARGKISITDRSGSKQTIDLRFAQNTQDVVDAINSKESLGVVASVDDDRLVLTDVSGGSSNLKVEDIDGGTTAADLGLGGIDTSAATATGSGVYGLHNGTAISSLRDGRGLDLVEGKELLEFNLQDGSTVSYSSELSSKTASVGQLIDEINAAGDGKISVKIGSDGKSLAIEDLTTGTNTFSVSSPTGSLAEQLGFDTPSSGGEIQGRRVIAGLSNVLLSSLGGGDGLGQLGEITVTDRSGASDTIDLSNAETLEDVISAINGSSSGVQAKLNRTKTGIEIFDTTGATDNALVIANGDSTDTATKLNIAVNDEVSSVDSGTLNRQFISRNTSLDAFSEGQSFPLGSIRITDSAGIESAVNLATTKPETVGELLDLLNGLSVGIEAKLSESGDGIVLVDTAGGDGALTIADVGSSRSAERLGIAGTAAELSVEGQTVNGIEGSRTIRIATDADTSIADLAQKINDLSSSPVNASLLSLGNSGGVRLLLSGVNTGADSRIAIDSEVGVSFSETAQGRDALLAFGANESSGGVLVSSTTNTFEGLVDDLEFTITGTSESPVSVTVAETSDTLTKQIDTFVTQFNKLRDKLSSLTSFDAEANTVGVLFGTNAALRIDLNFGKLLSAPIRGAGPIASLGQLGIRLNDTGKLEFDETKFEAALTADPDAVKEFFTNETSGFSTKAKAVADSLAGVESGSLLSRSNSLQTQIEQNAKRVSTFDIRLDKQRTRLLTQFYNMETAIAKLQQNLSSLNNLQIIQPFTG